MPPLLSNPSSALSFTNSIQEEGVQTILTQLVISADIVMGQVPSAKQEQNTEIVHEGSIYQD